MSVSRPSNTRRMARILRVIALLLATVHEAAKATDGLQLEPAASKHRAGPMAVNNSCAGLRLLPAHKLRLQSSVRPENSTLKRDVSLPSPSPISVDLSRRIDAISFHYGHEAALIKAIIQVESAFNPSAVSSKGAIGLMQIMPTTASGLGVAAPHRELFDPVVNLRAGARHLHRLRERFPDRLDLILAAYNAGEGAVIRWAGVPPYAETRAYVLAVQNWQRRYRNASRSVEVTPTELLAAPAFSCDFGALK
jgi:hypothetical protein